MAHSLAAIDKACLDHIASLGYRELRACGEAGLCGVKRFLFTEAVVVGISDSAYERRYCFETTKDALASLAAWDGVEHPPGPWVMCKGANINLMNPALAREA